jgi:Carboxypeptidase regulatory-like domain
MAKDYTATVNVPPTRLWYGGILVGACLLWSSAAVCQSGKRIEGRVVDPSGGVMSNARVTLFSEEQVRVATVDADGRFKFTDVAKGSYGIEATSEGFAIGTVEGVEINDKDILGITVSLRVGEGRGTFYCFLALPLKVMPVVSYEKRLGDANLSGTINDYSGTPLAGATVYLMKPNGARVTTTSNASGEFRFADLEPGKYALETVHDGYRDAPHRFHIARQNLTRLMVAMIRVVPCDSPGAMPSQVSLPPERDFTAPLVDPFPLPVGRHD